MTPMYRIGMIGTGTTHMYRQGKLENPRALCGYRADFVTWVTDGTAACRRCQQAASARYVREKGARRYR